MYVYMLLNFDLLMFKKKKHQKQGRNTKNAFVAYCCKRQRMLHIHVPVPKEGHPWSPRLASLLAGVGKVFGKGSPSH